MSFLGGVKDAAHAVAARVVQMAVLSRGKANGVDQAKFRDRAQPVSRAQPFGLRSIAPPGSRIITLGVNAGRGNRVYISAEHPDVGPTDLEEGEVALYNGSAQVLTIRLTKDGDIQIIPAAGRKVKLGSKDDGELDPVVLYSKLKEQFDRFVLKHNQHTHPMPGNIVVTTTIGAFGVPTAGVITGATSATPDTMDPLTSAAGSSNVVAKK